MAHDANTKTVDIAIPTVAPVDKLLEDTEIKKNENGVVLFLSKIDVYLCSRNRCHSMKKTKIDSA